MNNLYNTQLQQHQQSDKPYYGGYNDNKMGFQQESLFSMAIYDMDSLAQNQQKQQQEPPAPPSNTAAFHPVDDYKDLSLRELLDLSDDFLFDDEMNGPGSMNPMPLPMMPGSGPSSHQQAPQMHQQRQQMDMPSMQSFSMSQMNMAPPLPQQGAVPNDVMSMQQQQPPSSNKKRRRQVSDDEASAEEDGLNNEGRFRPYQAGQWAERFNDLCRYREQTGNCLVPHTFKENLPLARWVKRQRYQFKLMQEGKPSTMTAERVQALEDIGFVWDSQGAAWGERLEELRDFRKIYMHCNVPSNYSENPQLATWVKCQRRQYKLYSEGKPSNMTLDRIRELEGIGFEWLLRSYKKARVN